MPHVTVTKIFRFEAAHRLLGYKGDCANIHGHSYVAEVTFKGKINDNGFVIDFKTIKENVGRYIDTHFDHALLLNIADSLSIQMADKTKIKTFLGNPTAENMALVILKATDAHKVKLWETSTSFVEVINDTPEDQ